MDPVFGIPALAALLLAFVYVRRIARRARIARAHRVHKPPKEAVRSLSQRSEMRAGDPISVMDDLQRTNSRPMMAASSAPLRRSAKSRTRR